MMAALMAMTSSWSSFFSSLAGTSVPRTRIIGKLPTFRCRSDAPFSTAIFRRSLTCMAMRVTRAAGLPRRSHRAELLAEGRLLLVDVGEPPVPVGGAAVDDVEEGALQRFGDRTAASGPDPDL